MDSTTRTFFGWVWVNVLRIIGAPLPLQALAGTPASVIVTAEPGGAGQCWTRLYHVRHGMPQVICSVKSFAGPTGLEERVGCGISMSLRASVDLHALVFRSDSYHWRCGKVKLPLPVWLTPGRVEVRHVDGKQGAFTFVLTVVHPCIGQIFRQVAHFKDGD